MDAELEKAEARVRLVLSRTTEIMDRTNALCRRTDELRKASKGVIEAHRSRAATRARARSLISTLHAPAYSLEVAELDRPSSASSAISFSDFATSLNSRD